MSMHMMHIKFDQTNAVSHLWCPDPVYSIYVNRISKRSQVSRNSFSGRSAEGLCECVRESHTYNLGGLTGP